MYREGFSLNRKPMGCHQLPIGNGLARIPRVSLNNAVFVIYFRDTAEMCLLK